MKDESGVIRRIESALLGQAMTLSSVQREGNLKQILTSALALYVLDNVERPLPDVLEELMDIECRAGRLVGLAIQQPQLRERTDLTGVLVGVLSYIPFCQI